MRPIRILIADDHPLFRTGLVTILSLDPEFEVIGEVSNGSEALRFLESGKKPDILLLDVSMPVMDGVATMCRIRKKKIDIPVLMLSVNDNEATIIQLMKLGVRGYIFKDTSPKEVKNSIREVVADRYYLAGVLPQYSDSAKDNKAQLPPVPLEELSDRELEFLRWTTTELTYKEIADKMIIGERTIDFYRDKLFARLQVKSRVGLALFAIRSGLVSLD